MQAEPLISVIVPVYNVAPLSKQYQAAILSTARSHFS